MRARVFLVLTVVVVVVASTFGLLVAGGPIKARQDRWDEARYRELIDLAEALYCEGDLEKRGPILPIELTKGSIDKHCEGAWIFSSDLTDDETGLPYVYVRISDYGFAVCATFYDAERAQRMTYQSWKGAEFDSRTGCITSTLLTDG